MLSILSHRVLKTIVVLKKLSNSRILRKIIRRKLLLTQYREGKWTGYGHCGCSVTDKSDDNPSIFPQS